MLKFKSYIKDNENKIIQENIINFLKNKFLNKNPKKYNDFNDFIKKAFLNSPEQQRSIIFKRLNFTILDLKDIIKNIAKLMKEIDNSATNWEVELLKDIDKLKNDITNGFWKTYDLHNRPDDFKNNNNLVGNLS